MNIKQKASNPPEIIDAALAGMYPNMSDETRRQVAKVAVLQPAKRKLKIGNEEMTVEELNVKIADFIEKNGVNRSGGRRTK